MVVRPFFLAPAWPRQSWFPDILLLSCAKPLRLPLRGGLLSQFKGKKLHQGLVKLHLHAWLLSGRQSDREVFLKMQPSAFLEQLDSQQGQYMTQNGQSFVLGVCQNKLILSVSLLSNYLNYFCTFLKTKVIHLLPLRVTGQLLQGQSISQAVLILVVMSFYHSCLKTVALTSETETFGTPLGLGSCSKSFTTFTV